MLIRDLAMGEIPGKNYSKKKKNSCLKTNKPSFSIIFCEKLKRNGTIRIRSALR
jgi:hypothetical protein